MNWPDFEYPLLFVLLIPLLWCLIKCKEQLPGKIFVHLHLFQPKKGWFKSEWLIKIITISALLSALASPVVFEHTTPDKRQGVDIVLSLDGSGSMSASGFDPKSRQSRFEAVQELAKAFVLKRINDNVGVVLFGDFAFIASPVTYEKEMVAQMIDYLGYGMAGQNTAIGEGIVMALRALEHSKAKSKLIVLLSDGEHNSGRIAPKEAVAMALERHIKIDTIGIGDANNYDKAMLEHIATQSGGTFFEAPDKEALRNVYEQIDVLERSSIKSRDYLIREYLAYWPLLIAFSALAFLFHRGQHL